MTEELKGDLVIKGLLRMIHESLLKVTTNLEEIKQLLIENKQKPRVFFDQGTNKYYAGTEVQITDDEKAADIEDKTKGGGERVIDIGDRY